MKIEFDFGPVVCYILKPSSELGVPLTLRRVGGPQSEGLDPTNDSHSQFESASFCRETYVCFLSVRETVASRHCVSHPEINGPLFCVKPPQVGGRESKAQGRTVRPAQDFLTPDNGLVRKVNPAIRLWSYTPLQLNWYLLSQDVTNRRESTIAKYKAECV